MILASGSRQAGVEETFVGDIDKVEYLEPEGSEGYVRDNTPVDASRLVTGFDLRSLNTLGVIMETDIGYWPDDAGGLAFELT